MVLHNKALICALLIRNNWRWAVGFLENNAHPRWWFQNVILNLVTDAWATDRRLMQLIQLITKLWEREREITSVSMCLSIVFGSNVSSYSETKFMFFTNSAVVVTSLVRSHVVVKLLNYVTDKNARVALTTLACMLTTCANCVCVCEGESRRDIVCTS